ncbi:MAG: amidohydrolase, partial [Actinomycetota bacterium]
GTVLTRYRSSWLLTDASSALIADGCVDVEDGLVSWSGPVAEAPPSDAAVVEHDGLLMPGFVNAHCHTPMVLLRGAGEGLPVDRWLHEVMWPREARLTPDDVYWGMLLGAAEQLLHGVTTTNEMYFHVPHMAAAATEVGIRTVLGAPLIDVPDRFGPIDAQFEAALDFAKQREADPLVSIVLGPHSTYAVSRSILEQVAEVARSADLAVHIHIAEMGNENELSKSNHGLPLVEFLDTVGLLGPHLMAAHGVWLDAADRERLAGHSVGVLHCPSSNLRHANGIAPVVAHRAAGLPVGLGTDGPASAPMLDMFTEMRLAAGLARGSGLDPAALEATDVLAMATTEGATALGRDDIGALTPGRRADMVALDISRSTYHPVVEPADIVTHLVWGGM